MLRTPPPPLLLEAWCSLRCAALSRSNDYITKLFDVALRKARIRTAIQIKGHDAVSTTQAESSDLGCHVPCDQVCRAATWDAAQHPGGGRALELCLHRRGWQEGATGRCHVSLTQSRPDRAAHRSMHPSQVPRYCFVGDTVNVSSSMESNQRAYWLRAAL